jgi:hypothetical protein
MYYDFYLSFTALSVSGVKNSPSLFLENPEIVCPQKNIEYLIDHW